MGRLKIKNKRKRLWLLKLIIIVGIFSFSFCYTLNYFSKNIDNEKFLKIILENGNSHMDSSSKTSIFGKLITLVSDINIKKPTTLLKTNYVGDNFTKVDEDDLDTIPKSNYVKDPYNGDSSSDPIVYIYNTHQSEEYSTNNLENYNVKPTVMMTSYILREKLNNNGIPTIVEENDVTEFLRTNNWNYASSYKVTRLLLDDIFNKNPSLKYFIDVHRDSAKKSATTATIGGREYAKILFVVGLENNNYRLNLNMMEELNNKFENKYPGLSRGLYKKKGAGVNGVYNQDFNANTILIEVGGQDNTIDEVYNTSEAISQILTEYIKERKI